MAAGIAGAAAGMVVTGRLYRLQLWRLSTAPRLLATTLIYWLIALVPAAIALARREKPSLYGFTREHIGKQIAAGIFIGLAMSAVITLLPILAGLGRYVDNGNRFTHLRQFAYDLAYHIAAVALAEEFVFRGFVYQKLKAISRKEAVAVVGSSVLFGLFHLPNGDIIQMALSALIGAFLCLCRIKIKNCTTLSLVVAHGVHDFMFTVWASTVLR